MSIEVKVTDMYCKICGKNILKNHSELSRHIYKMHQNDINQFFLNM